MASRRLAWPSIVPVQVGECESSKSAMYTLAPEFMALMTIFRSTGPVISTRRSCKSRGMGANRPRAVADRPGLGQEIRHLPGIQFALSDGARRQQARSFGTECPPRVCGQTSTPRGVSLFVLPAAWLARGSQVR